MMKIFRQAVLAMLAVVPVVAMAEKRQIERYQPIIDRQMFGPLPPDFDPDAFAAEVFPPPFAELSVKPTTGLPSRSMLMTEK